MKKEKQLKINVDFFQFKKIHTGADEKKIKVQKSEFVNIQNKISYFIERECRIG